MKTYVCLLLLSALALTGCRTIDPAGPYKGNSALYTQDVGIRAAYDTIHAFVLWEYQNRSALATKPEIRKAADQLRTDTPRWITTAIALRDAYAAVPSNDNLMKLQQALAVIKTGMVQATSYMSASTN